MLCSRYLEDNSEKYSHFEAVDFITLINDLSFFMSSVKNKLGSVKPTSIKKLDIASVSLSVKFSASMVLLVLLWI